MRKVYVGILAGGSGERLWPLSKKNYPKQLVPFLNEKSLLEQTIERVSSLVPSKELIFVVAQRHHEALVQQVVGDKVGFIIAEPCGRNTAPAILFACRELTKRDPTGIVVFVPADHFIPDAGAFQKILSKAVSHLQDTNALALIGVKPKFPATSYGYIEVFGDQNPRAVIKFHEKPTKELAQNYIEQKNMFWNVGIFAGQITAFLDQFKYHAPVLYDAMEAYDAYKLSYQFLPSVSIDYAVMEKTKQAIVFVADFEWYDVGSVPMFLSLQKTFAQTYKPLISIEGKNNLASSSKKIVACVGVSDLCIIETDDVLLIVNKDKGELVKKVLESVPEMIH